MTLIDFLRILAKNFKLMALAGITMASVVYLATRNPELEFSSETLINTGLVSGYNLESSDGQKVDYTYTNNEIENLISVATSNETLEELGVLQLAQYLLLKVPDPELITLEGWEELKAEDVHNVRKLVADSGELETTKASIRRFLAERKENPVQKLFYSKHPFFGFEHLKTIKVTREGKSDLLRFKYSTTDPAVCRHTLVELTDIFIKKYRSIKEVQSTDVLEFFEKATAESQTALNVKENELLGFMVQNKIINYYEQTRFIAAKKEDLDEMYFKEVMHQAGAANTLKRLEKELVKHINMSELNTKLVSKREELAIINSKIAKMEVFSFDSTGTERPALDFLKTNAGALEKDIKNVANSTFAVLRTPEGVEVKDLLTQWLKQVIETEQAVARLDVLQERKKEFDEIYSKFAPWGSQLTRIERAIDVAERAYLENLHSYNQARLHQYNMMMGTNLKVIDSPFMPAKPAPSKRMMMVILAFMAGFVLTLAAAVALEMLDSTLKNPIIAAKTTGLEVYGSFPKFPADPEKETIDFGYIEGRAAGQLLQNIKLEIRRQGKEESKAKRVTVMSTRQGEGKSYLARMAVGKLRASNERVAYFYPGDKAKSGHPDDKPYLIGHQFFDIETEAELIGSKQFNPQDYDYIFLETPGLLTESFPVDLMAKYDIALMVARGNRTWDHADSKALKTVSQALNTAPKLAVNALRPDVLETSLGEIPKRRSIMRVLLKRIVQLDFSGKRTI